jgi:hypothetical protein
MTKTFQKIEIFFIAFYRKLLSPLLFNVFKGGCRFEPTCSEYAILAVKKYGAILGTYKSIVRFLRCNPFSKHPHSYPLD